MWLLVLSAVSVYVIEGKKIFSVQNKGYKWVYFGLWIVGILLSAFALTGWKDDTIRWIETMLTTVRG